MSSTVAAHNCMLDGQQHEAVEQMNQAPTGSLAPDFPVPDITVAIPVYNEAATIVEVLQRVIDEKTPKDIVIVDDGSTDETMSRLEAWKRNWDDCTKPSHVRSVTLLAHPINQGKGAAIRTALRDAKAQFLIVQDADLEVSPDEYPWLLKPLLADEADIVVGYRTLSGRPTRFAHGAGIWLLNLIVRVLYGVSIRDEACCFKVLKVRDLALMKLECNRFEFCPEVIAKAARMGLRFAEIPVAYHPRDIRNGKKLRLSDGLQAMATLWKYRRWNK
jgi:glycosyltransferase involved in cell wall biosynthesis